MALPTVNLRVLKTLPWERLRNIACLLLGGVTLIISWLEESPSSLRGQLLLVTALIAIGYVLTRRTFETYWRVMDRYLKPFRTMPEPYYVWGAALIFLLLTSLFSQLLFSHLPHIADTQAQYAQSKIFASGRIYAELEHPEFFSAVYLLSNGTKYYGMYPPGHSAILALGQLIGMPWIINPLLGALFLVALYYLAREVANQAVARVAVVLVLLSPFVVFMSSEYMNHATALLMTTLFTLCYIRLLKNPDTRYGLLAGLALGYLCITRPQSAAILCLFFVPHAAYMFFTQLRRYAKPLLDIIALTIPFLILFAFYNKATTGHYLQTGYQQMTNDTGLSTWMGIIWERWPGEDLRRVAAQMSILNMGVFGWKLAVGTLVAFVFLFGAAKKYGWMLASIFIVTAMAWIFSGCTALNLFGARYFYETSGVLIILSALAFQRLPAIARRRFGCRVPLPVWRSLIVTIVLALSVQAATDYNRKLYQLYAWHYWEGNVDYFNAVSNVTRPAIVFIGDSRYYQYVAHTMPPDENALIIFARDRGAENALLIKQYPERDVFLAKGYPGTLYIVLYGIPTKP